MTTKQGWYRESRRHSLASRGIKTTETKTPLKNLPVEVKTKELSRDKYADLSNIELADYDDWYTKEITMLHGTSSDSVKNILKYGINNPFVSDDYNSAEYFGKDKGMPKVLRITAPAGQLWYSTWDGEWHKPLTLEEFDDLEESVEEEDEKMGLYSGVRLRFRGFVPPDNIRLIDDREFITKDGEEYEVL